MRKNKHGVRGLSGVRLERGLVYFWVPPISLQKAGIFKHKTLGTDFEIAVGKARDWNAKLEAYRVAMNGVILADHRSESGRRDLAAHREIKRRKNSPSSRSRVRPPHVWMAPNLQDFFS